MATPAQLEKIGFDVFEVDPKTEELWRGMRRVRCQRQPFRVLLALLGRPGEVVSREQLQLAVWGTDSPADADHSLGIAVNKLREALGDSAEHPRFIETLSRRGYRFIAPVTVVTADETESPSDTFVPTGTLAIVEPGLGSHGQAAPLGSPASAAGAASASINLPLEPVDRLPAPRSVATSGAVVEPTRPSWRPRLVPVACLLALVTAALFLGALLGRYFAPGRSTPLRIEQLTHSDSIFPGVPAMESFPVLVSDGSRIYSSILEDGQNRIASIDAGSGEAEGLQLPDEIVNPTLGDISPDGSRLLVRSHLSSGSEQPVWVVPRSGGSALRAGNVLAHDAVWMPDGMRILYAVGNELEILRLSDGATSRFAVLPGRAFWMRWSPDGRLLRFTILDPLSHTSSLWQIGSTAAGQSAGAATPLLPGWTRPAAECCGVWTADGHRYLFQSAHEGGSDIWQLRGQSTESPEKLTNGPLRYTAPMVDRGTDRVYFVGLDVRSELERFDAEHQNFAVERGLLADASRVSYSRDRTLVAWTDGAGRLWRGRSASAPVSRDAVAGDAGTIADGSTRRAGSRALAAAQSRPASRTGANGLDKVQLTPDTLEVFLAHWSPDSRRLVAMARAPGQSWQLFLVSAEGGKLERLLNESRNEADPTWSPDGRRIAFGRTPDLMGRESGPKQIEMLDLATRTVVPVPGSEGLFSPRWSPDGRWIAALTLGEQRLMLYDTQTRTWRSMGGVQAADPVWSADSSALFIHAVFARPQTIERIAVPNGTVQPVATLASPLVADKADYVFVGLTREQAPLVRVRTATGNLYSLALTR